MLGLGIPIRINKRASGGSPTPPPSRDADTTAFMTAISIPDDSTLYYSGTPQEITGEGMWDAVNALVLSLKADGLWTDIKAFYPFVGGTASTHERNLVNPADTNAAFRVTWVGGVTHSRTGVKPNGTNGFGNTHLVPSSTFTSQNNLALGVYSRDDTNLSSAVFGSDSGNRLTFWPWHLSVDFAYFSNNSSLEQAVNGSSLGLLHIERSGASANAGYQNNVLVHSGTTASSGLPSQELFLCAENRASFPIGSYDTREQAVFFAIDKSLSSIERTALYNSINTYQTALGRNV